MVLRGLLLLVLLAVSPFSAAPTSSAAPSTASAQAAESDWRWLGDGASTVASLALPSAPAPRHVPRPLAAPPPPLEVIEAAASIQRPRPAWQRVARLRSDGTSDP